jgi:hypothetical protein
MAAGGVEWVLVACLLRPDLTAVVVDVTGRPHVVAGPLGCVDGRAAVRGELVGREPGGRVRVRFRGVAVVVSERGTRGWAA